MNTAFEGAVSGVAGSGAAADAAAAFPAFAVGLVATGGLALAEADGADVFDDAGASPVRDGTGRTVAPEDPDGPPDCAGT